MRFMTKPLEYDKILKLIAAYSKTETIKKAILGLEPMTDSETINEALDDVLDMDTLISRLGVWPLLPDFDIKDLLENARTDRSFSIKEILTIRLFLIMERDVRNHLRQAVQFKIESNLVKNYRETLANHEGLLAMINGKMDEDGQMLDHATPELLRIRKAIRRLEKSLQDRLQKVLSDLSAYLNEPVITIRNNRFCVPVKDTFKHRVKGVIHDMSASKQTVYIEPEVTRSITAEIESLKIQEDHEIQAIILDITKVIVGEMSSLSSNLDVFLSIDFNQSKALYGKTIKATRPNINNDMTIHLYKARHPLIDPEVVVPIDVTLDQKLSILMITGPNTGGKTVALKTVGLITLMAQTGLLVPVDDVSDIAIFDQVYADIGDEQSIQQSLSTFSSHLTRIIRMIEGLQDRTLVLLDEIGSGTDPNEGVALAIAIINQFRTKDIRMMVTTHYSELKTYAYQEQGMFTASVAFDRVTLKPLYHLQMGTTGASHAFLIARRLGLPETVVQDAMTLYQGRQTDLQKMMDQLSEDMLVLSREKEHYHSEVEALKRTRDALEREKDMLTKSKTETLEKVRIKEEKKWAEVTKEAKALLLELKNKSHLTKPELAELTHRLKGQSELYEDEDAIMDDTLKKGDQVFILPYQQYGIVQRVREHAVRVTFGKFNLDFKPSDLRLERGPKQEKKPKETPIPKPSVSGATPARVARFEIDLRGYRYEEVSPVLDQAIDQAMLSSMKTIRIIHGFGTGAVRQAVHEFIKRSPFIESHRFGGEGEGLNGVTIITLK